MSADPNPQQRLGVGRFALIGSQMAAFTLLGVIVDYFLGSLPWATVLLTLLGFIAVIAQLARAVLKNGPGRAGRGGDPGLR